MKNFLSCDWGTSSFRLRLVRTEDLSVLAEEVSNEGIAAIYKNWQGNGARQEERLLFYQLYLLAQVKKLEQKINYKLDWVPLILTGMASSSIGMIDLPYKELPFKTNGSDLNTHTIEPSNSFTHQLIIISGGNTGNDVLRGEETLLIGCDVTEAQGESIYIFPGTHSKHILVESGEAKRFKTYMTGEVFDLLSTKSILSNSVEKDNAASGDLHPSFEKGIIEGASGNLLNAIFHVRTNQLFKKNSPSENYHYLSGVLIGAELKDLFQRAVQFIFLVSGKGLKNQYAQGLALLGLDNKMSFIDADEALVRGQLRIYKAINQQVMVAE